jgi:hypothetical protein
MVGKCLCALGEFSTMAVTTGILQFRADFEASLKQLARSGAEPELSPANANDNADLAQELERR